MKTRIAIYGGTNLQPAVVRFVGRLTRRLLEFPDVVVVSGGFGHYERHPGRISVDRAVADAAVATLNSQQLAERFETWLPAPALDRRSVVRIKHGTIRELTGSAQARRFAIVNEVDAIVTVSGMENTVTVLELALAVGKPAIPVAWTGGASARMWKRNADALTTTLKLGQRVVTRLQRTPRGSADRGRLALDIARAAHDAAERRCLVLMPFGRGHDGFYRSVLRQAIEDAGFIPRRIDKDEYSGNIPTLFRSSLERAHAILVDVTGANPNVMYELGHVHARLTDPPAVILRERLTPEVSRRLPFYLRHERLMAAADGAAGHRYIARQVVAYLRSVDRRRHAVGR